MKKDIILITSIIVVVFSCLNASKMKKQEWEIINANGINEENKVFDFLLFLNKENAVLLGSGYSDEDLLQRKFDEFKTVIYYSTDTGRSWNKRDLGKGVNSQAA
jgi:phosphoribosyl-AMP cyclohydrolase